MGQHCGTCANLDLHDKKVAGDWFHGEHDEFKCIERRKYVSQTEGSSCRYYREMPSNSSSGCFITTIVVNLNGYDDKCELLQTLRNFRDTHLQRNEKGIEILKEYDVVGPILSNAIIKENNKILSLKLLSTYIIPTAQYIKENMYEEAIALYSSMVNYLEIRYGISYNHKYYSYGADANVSEMGHGRLRVNKESVNC